MNGPTLPKPTTAKGRKGDLGGRPRKYAEPSRPVTVTLPNRTLEDLKRLHADRGKAIVKAVQTATQGSDGARPQVEIVETTPGKGLIIIGPSSALRRIPFLHLVEVSPSRYVLALDPGNDFRSLELAISDAFEDLSAEEIAERSLLQDLLGKIRKLRKNDRVSMAEILFVRVD
ncbi:MAG: hypothetical protein KA004_15000 [Verrucomicrobiales bacterium]|nr:hypothetical protein [Verrucomicrobiales bacterium]